MGFGEGQHARAESISKRAPLSAFARVYSVRNGEMSRRARAIESRHPVGADVLLASPANFDPSDTLCPAWHDDGWHGDHVTAAISLVT